MPYLAKTLVVSSEVVASSVNHLHVHFLFNCLTHCSFPALLGTPMMPKSISSAPECSLESLVRQQLPAIRLQTLVTTIGMQEIFLCHQQMQCCIQW